MTESTFIFARENSYQAGQTFGELSRARVDKYPSGKLASTHCVFASSFPEGGSTLKIRLRQIFRALGARPQTPIGSPAAPLNRKLISITLCRIDPSNRAHRRTD